MAVCHSDREDFLRQSKKPNMPVLTRSTHRNPPTLRFEGGEHTAIGDDTLLRFVKDAPAIPARQVELHLPNGLALTYGQVIALGGDFYGIPGQPISDGARQPNACNASSLPSTPGGAARLTGRSSQDPRGDAKGDKRGQPGNQGWQASP
jgi:hypothetical protein